MTPPRSGPSAPGYRASHSEPCSGDLYSKTYREGYYLYQWQLLERPLLAKILRRQAASGARRLLDFACGTGRILSLAERHFPETWGVDVSDSMLAIARRECERSTLVCQDLTREPLAERFDLVTSFRFFLNAEPDLRARALVALRRCLRPDGVLIANVHVNRRSPLGVAYRTRNWLLDEQRANTLGYEEFERLLNAHGFVVEEVHWYSYLPRTGPWLGWVPRLMMRPVETLCRALPFVPRWMAQSFLVVCTRAEG